ncbi:uncharacterized protein C10orf105 homolog isoform X3 [Suricata suricatta]|uniref:uncharacterized protein C10orf105 homolog isoform X3 n=1 Tax=Suricata suricatta TaxID=37032 RepID=UPI00115569D4|nr:uncharacterized protein C10orf105 homolog isoform X3 [Suricata suricatta]
MGGGVCWCPQSAGCRVRPRAGRRLDTGSRELGPATVGAMSTQGPSPLAFLTAPVTPGSTTTEANDPLPVLIALACIFLLLASCLLFMALCKPAALDPSRRQARECMPHHPGSPSEPQLRLWKRLGSLRRSLHSFRRGRPAPRRPLPGCDDSIDCDCTESTKM